MKKTLTVISAALLLASCANESARYTDLETGKTINIEKSSSGGMVNAETKKPVYIYVDNQTNDTIYGRTGAKINGKLVKTESGDIKYVGDIESGDVQGELKIKSGDYKMKVDEDGDVKIKDGDKKTKIDGETGEKKVKND
ncbi:MAG: hypothetical protein EOO05_21175 [Chitinophagaceae bacterium]|nr:MAG: hypothetical protein EOO05_21175 [Chitinophagaceae bacterium]